MKKYHVEILMDNGMWDFWAEYSWLFQARRERKRVLREHPLATHKPTLRIMIYHEVK